MLRFRENERILVEQGVGCWGWLLHKAGEFDRPTGKEIVVERAEIVWKALRIFQRTNADLADCLIERSAAAAGCSMMVTFDRGAVKGCEMTLVT
jgi:hypothetical protein